MEQYNKLGLLWESHSLVYGVESCHWNSFPEYFLLSLQIRLTPVKN